MGGLHLHLRRLAAVGVTLIALSGCGSDEVELPETLRGETTCVWVADTHVYFEDGSSKLLTDPSTHAAGAACTCMTREEFDAGGWQDELNAQALEICNDLAARHGKYDWTECEERYEAGRWLDFAFWNHEELTPTAAYDPGCVGE